MISTLVWMKWPTNIGYAIGALEELFFEVALQLAAGDQSRVHFAYPDLSPGPPRSLPPGFQNLTTMSIDDVSRPAMHRFEAYLRQTPVDFVLTFDVQPVHPAFSVMRRHGVKTIVSYWGAPISSPMPRWKLALKKAQIRLTSDRADALVFESRAMADLALNGRGVPPSMIEIVPLGADLTRFRPAASDYVYRTFGIPADRKVVVFSGHCTTRKGIGTLIGAALEVLVGRKRRDVCFLICGNQGDESRRYEAMYAGLGVDEWIRFAGYRNDMLQIFQSSFCGVLPSSGWDSFTLSSVEMAATGLPIVASRLQGLAEAVLHEQTGLLFEPGSASALADALERLLDRPALAAELGKNGRARCEQELSREAQRTRLLAAVRKHLPGATAGDHTTAENSRQEAQ